MFLFVGSKVQKKGDLVEAQRVNAAWVQQKADSPGILPVKNGGLVKNPNFNHVAVCQNPGTPGEPQNSWDSWMFIPLKIYL